MTPEVNQRLHDALGAANLIARATKVQTLDGYLGDEWFQSAAERQLEITGEAFTQALRLDPGVISLVPDFRGWIGPRNIIAHAYQDLKPQIIWQTIQEEIPELIAALTASLPTPMESDPPYRPEESG